MKVVVQKVSYAKCVVDNNITGKIDEGLLLFVGFKDTDTIKEIDYMVNKIIKLRIFKDELDKMNKNIFDVNGKILSISQFTLYGSVKKGNRPSFISALEPRLANEYYLLFNKKLRETGIDVSEGIFGSDMKISLLNDGPVTIILDTDEFNIDKA